VTLVRTLRRRIVAAGGGGGGGDVSTSFPDTENPISQSGLWINGGTDGGSWNDVRTTPGLAFAAAIVSTTDDDLAVLTTAFGLNQYIEGTVHRAGGYSPPDSHEIELLVRFVISSGVARGCEINWGHAGNAQIVKWNGDLGDFDTPVDLGGIGAPADGDRLRVEAIGDEITVYKNDVSVGSTTMAGLADGQPGIGFFPRTGATLSSLGWSSIVAGELS
jgi:hypothetical protein